MKKVADVVDLLQALADGKALEVRMGGVGNWEDSYHDRRVPLSALLADFGKHQYRIKRIPREVVMWEYENGKLYQEGTPQPPWGTLLVVGKIKFREVLDD